MFPRFTGEVEGIAFMDRAFNRVEQRIGDFRFVWGPVSQEIYQIQREQFASQGAHGLSGRWAKLSPAYAKWKQVHYPNMPILQATTALYQSMTSPDAPDSIFRPEATQLTMGTKREGATVHQRTRPIYSFTEADKTRITKAIQAPLVGFIRRQGLTILENAA